MNKQWIAIIASARRDKNTEALTDYFISALSEKDIIVKKFALESQHISTCTGCEYCIKTGNCKIKDDVTDLIESMKQADGFIFASPTYNYNISAQMKAFLDRTFCLNDYNGGVWSSRLSQGKKAIIVAVCAGNTEDSMGYTVKGMMTPITELGIDVVDVFEYYNTKNSPVYENKIIGNNIFNRVRSNSLI